MKQEVWQQDSQDTNLWHGANGLMVNSAALSEREAFFDVKRIFQRAEDVFGLDAIHYPKKRETWVQDARDPNLWHGDNDLLINTDALNKREAYFDVTRVNNLGAFYKEESSGLHPI